MKIIKLIILDVDGIMTDGSKYYNSDGSVVMKKFCDKDWTAIKKVKSVGINVIFVSGDSSNRGIADKRSIDFFCSQNVDKADFIPVIEKKYRIKSQNMCYFGDDLFDISIMKSVAYAYCTKSSPKEVIDICHVLYVNGGDNAVLKLVEHLEDSGKIEKKEIKDIIKKINDLDKKESY